MLLIREYFKKLFTFGVNPPIAIIDIEHVEERFEERFPDLSWSEFKQVLQDGLKVIKGKYSLQIGNYMIISKSLGIKIPVELRPDRNNPKQLVFALMTVLDARQHPANTHRDINLMVASFERKKYIEINV